MKQCESHSPAWPSVPSTTLSIPYCRIFLSTSRSRCCLTVLDVFCCQTDSRPVTKDWRFRRTLPLSWPVPLQWFRPTFHPKWWTALPAEFVSKAANLNISLDTNITRPVDGGGGSVTQSRLSAASSTELTYDGNFAQNTGCMIWSISGCIREIPSPGITNTGNRLLSSVFWSPLDAHRTNCEYSGKSTLSSSSSSTVLGKYSAIRFEVSENIQEYCC